MPITLKSASTNVKNLSPQIALAMGMVHLIYQAAGTTLVVTSAQDSKHMAGSKHHQDNLALACEAFDARTHNLTAAQKNQIQADIQAKLVPLGFDLVHESPGLANEHFHVEFDPKGRKLFALAPQGPQT